MTSSWIRYIPEVDLKRFEMKRVVVYARVSRRNSRGHQSIKQQTIHLEHDINNHPGWQFAGYYVDEGITGTKTDRPALHRLLHDARDGKIDIILTKSVSRFGRNFISTLEIIQELRSLGVTVFFDEEQINTSEPDAMVYLQYLLAQSENEAKQISQYQRWAIRQRFAQGIPMPTKLYGYRLEQKQLQVIPEEAVIVKRIYTMYLSGMGRNRICKQLNSEDIPSPSGARWRTSSIYTILTNEKYTGNMILQKYFTQDPISKQSKINRGELPRYYVEDTHEAIISQEIYDQVQSEIARRAKTYRSQIEASNFQIDLSPASNALTSDQNTKLFHRLIYCPYCHTHYRYKRYKKDNGKDRCIWMCADYAEFGSTSCPNKSIPEAILKKTTRDVLLTYNLIKPSTELTNEVLALHIKRIIAHHNQTLEFHLHNNTSVTMFWDFEPRSASWTPEMKQKAKERGKKRASANNAKAPKPTNQQTNQPTNKQTNKPINGLLN